MYPNLGYIDCINYSLYKGSSIKNVRSNGVGVVGNQCGRPHTRGGVVGHKQDVHKRKIIAVRNAKWPIFTSKTASPTTSKDVRVILCVMSIYNAEYSAFFAFWTFTCDTIRTFVRRGKGGGFLFKTNEVGQGGKGPKSQFLV